MAENKEIKGQQADYIFLECDADHAFEKTSNNSRWINKIDGGLELPENSLLSVQYAGLNIRGSGSDVIEFKNEKIGESEFYEYNNTTYEYEKKKYDVYDNKVTLFLEFYKNQDGLYNYPLPYPWWSYPTTDYSNYWTALGNNKNMTTEELQVGITSSTYNSIFNYAFPIDNKRYTILVRNPNSVYNGSYIGRDVNGVTYPRSISNYEYSIFHNKVEIEIDKGFVSPSSVAEQVSQQLEKHDKPAIKNMRCWHNSADPNDPSAVENWSEYLDVEGGLTCETEVFKLFKCATRRSFYATAFNDFWNSYVNPAQFKNNDASEVQAYQENFEYIGCYNPELYLYGRSILYDNEYADYQKTFVFLNSITCVGTLQSEFQEHDMYTNIPYDDAILSQFNNIFKIIRNDTELYQTKVGIYTNSTPQNSVFLHADCLQLAYASLSDYKKRWFGTDYNSAFLNRNLFTNPLYLTCDTSITTYDDANAYGVFHKWRTNDGKAYVMVKGRFWINKTGANAPYFQFYTANSISYGGLFSVGDPVVNHPKEEYVPANFPIASVQYTRIGWDRHFSAQGNQCIMLWNGLTNNTAFKPEIVHKDKQNPDITDQLSILQNSFTTPSESGNTNPKYYDYDTGNNEIYLGADNFLFNFDDVESRFNISQLHTARKQFNNIMAGYDASVLTGVGLDASESPEIYYPQTLTGVTKVAFPLDINGDGNTAIYEVSPTKLVTDTQEVARAFTDLKVNTIFDSNCGIYIANFGVTENNFNNSLWDILGFSFGQVKTYMVDNLGEQIMLNRTYRFLNLGVNLKDTPQYPFTSNAQINSNEIISWKTNPFSISYFNTLNIPNNFRMAYYNDTKQEWDYNKSVNRYRIIQNQESTLMFADVLPLKSNIPFYQVRSDIIPILKYYGGNNQQNGKLPVVAIVNKSMAGADYFVNQGDNSMTYIITKRVVLNTVTTEIYDNFGRPAILDEHSSVIFRIQVPYNEPNVTPFLTLGEFEEAQEQEQNKK